MVTDFVKGIVEVCNREFERWGQGSANERDVPHYRYVGEYWEAVGHPEFDGRAQIDNSPVPWGTPFVCYCVGQAGASERFLYTESHCHYVEKAMKQADGTDEGFAYTARHPDRYAPRIGDILIGGRGSSEGYDYEDARRAYRSARHYPSSGEIVVAVHDGHVETVAGNVDDSVKKRNREISETGLLRRRPSASWIAVLECVI
jgi:hypothetical protein